MGYYCRLNWTKLWKGSLQIYFYVLWYSPGQDTGVGSLSLHQGLFLTQGWKLHLLHLPAEPQGKPKNTGVVPSPFSRGSSQPRYRNGVSWIEHRFFTNWAIREALFHSRDITLSLIMAAKSVFHDLYHLALTTILCERFYYLYILQQGKLTIRKGKCLFQIYVNTLWQS